MQMRMNRLILALAACCSLAACDNGNAGKGRTEEGQSQKDHVEVLYFHSQKRCATCMAIETRTHEAIEAEFAEELKSGALVFKTIDISEPTNEYIADKYEIAWSSLLVSNWKDGKETYDNITEYAFANARTSPDKFKNGVAQKLRTLLK